MSSKTWVVSWYDGDDNRLSIVRNVDQNDINDHLTLTMDHRNIAYDDIHAVVQIEGEHSLVVFQGLTGSAHTLDEF